MAKIFVPQFIRGMFLLSPEGVSRGALFSEYRKLNGGRLSFSEEQKFRKLLEGLEDNKYFYEDNHKMFFLDDLSLEIVS